MDTKRIMAEAQKEMNRLDAVGWSRQLDFDCTTLMSTIAALQLALRHPSFTKRPSANLIRQVVDKMIEGFPEDCPNTIQLAKLGFHKRFDE